MSFYLFIYNKFTYIPPGSKNIIKYDKKSTKIFYTYIYQGNKGIAIFLNSLNIILIFKKILACGRRLCILGGVCCASLWLKISFHHVI